MLSLACPLPCKPQLLQIREGSKEFHRGSYQREACDAEFNIPSLCFTFISCYIKAFSWGSTLKAHSAELPFSQKCLNTFKCECCIWTVSPFSTTPSPSVSPWTELYTLIFFSHMLGSMTTIFTLGGANPHLVFFALLVMSEYTEKWATPRATQCCINLQKNSIYAF